MKIFLFTLLLFIYTPCFAADDTRAADNQLKEISSDNYPAGLNGVVSSINKGSYKEALKELKKSQAQIKSDRKTKKRNKPAALPADKKNYLKGVSLRKLGKYKEALRALKASAALRGSNADVIAEIAYTLLALNKTDKALQYFKEALWFSNLKEHSIAEIHYQIGLIYQIKDDEKLAQETFQQVLDVDPSYYPASIKLAEMKFKEGEKRPAIKILSASLEKNPNNEELLQILAGYLLVNVDPLVDEEDIKKAYEYINIVMRSKEGKERYTSKAFPVYIKALLITGKVKEADAEVKAAKKFMKNDPTLQRLMQQIKMEKNIK